MRYFHGGIPDLKPGQLITPHEPNYVDGCPTCEAKKRGQQPIIEGLGVVDPLTERPDRVYITTDRDYARFYASKYPTGDLYVVDPAGDIEPSTEDHFPTWTVPTARVVSVYERAVRLTPHRRRTLLRRWAAADAAALLGGVR